jgi:hypothetical protein
VPEGSPESSRYRIELSKDLQVPVLLKILDPLFRELKRKRHVRDWQHLFTESALELDARPAPHRTHDDMLAVLQKGLGPALMQLDTKIKAHPMTYAPREKAHWRWGGETGIRIQILFQRRMQSFSLELFRILLDTPTEVNDLMIQGIVLFCLESCQVPRETWAKGLDLWRAYLLSKIKVQPGFNLEHLERVEQDVRARIAGRVPAGGPLSWRKIMPPAFVPAFSKFERTMRRIGRLLQRNRPEFRPDAPLEFVVLHSYAHVICMRVRVFPAVELALCRILFTELESAKAQQDL